MKILIVDDNKDLAETMQSYFDNHDCVTASCGREGSEILGLQDFDLVITDIDMPSGGGERILTEMSVKSTPVFVYTGNRTRIDNNTYSKLGATQVFTKPDGFVKLTEAVKEMADGLAAAAHNKRQTVG